MSRMRQKSSSFLDLRRAVQEYPICRRKLQQVIKEGRLPAYRFDGKLIVTRDDVERLLTAKPVGADLDRIVEQALSELVSK